MTETNKLIQKTWVQNTILVVIAIAGIYGLIYIDVVSRAKEAYMEAEKYMAWNTDPKAKETFFNTQYLEKKKDLETLFQGGKISKSEFDEKMEIIQFDRDFRIEESSLKYAFQWYKDTYELFSPPESKWVKMAREKAPQALTLWKEELTAKKIPFEDYMFE